MKNLRLWEDGVLRAVEVSSVELAKRMAQDAGEHRRWAWIDLTSESVVELNELAGVLDLHDLAVEDALATHERQKVSRFTGHALLRVTDVSLGTDGRARIAPLTAFVLPHAIVTVRDPSFPAGAVLERMGTNKELASCGPCYVLWAVLDVVVDNVMDVLDAFDERAEDLSERLFDRSFEQAALQQSIFTLRRDTAAVRRQSVPLREMTSSVSRRESALEISATLQPYFADVHDHALHAAEMADSLRDHLSGILETNLALQSSRKDEITKKVTSWAAIIAVPTLVTGFFGQNVAIPGEGTVWGAWLSVVVMLATSIILFWQFRRRDWL